MFRTILTLLILLSSSVFLAQTKPSKEYTTHLNAAKSHKVGLVKNKTKLDQLVKQGKMARIKQRGYGYRIDKLTHSHPYLIPKGQTVLNNIANDFVKKTGQNFFVVTSLTRTESDQNRLRRVNTNASSNDSSHSYGAALDISYIRFNNKKQPNTKLENALADILKKYQKNGKIYFVKEKQSRCFHIIIR